MAAEIRYEAQEYWNACQLTRRKKNMGLFKMEQVQTTSEAVRRRVHSFLAMHRHSPLSKSQDRGGDDIA